MASSAKLREEREWSEGANEQQGSAPEGVRGFIERAWSRCRLHLDGGDWAMQVVLLERRRELGPGTRSDRTVVLCCGRGVVRFSAGTGKMARAVACPVGQGPGRGLRRAGCTMPCSSVCGVVQTVVCARGNARAGLDMPGRRRARAGQGHGVAYGGSGRQRSIGLARRWVVGSGGAVVADGFLSKPLGEGRVLWLRRRVREGWVR
jgi:hypothetical protein